MVSWGEAQQNERRKRPKKSRKRLSLWSKFVMLVGYATLLYSAASGVIYLLVLLKGNT